MKKVKKIRKNHIKNSQKIQIFDDFVFWVTGIQEDEPVPFEVKNIYFVLDYSNGDIVLSYTGSDKKLDIFDLALYLPLEGEYLFSSTLKQLAKCVFESKKSISKKQIFDMLKEIVFSGTKKISFLKDKNIFFGIRYHKIKY